MSLIFNVTECHLISSTCEKESGTALHTERGIEGRNKAAHLKTWEENMLAIIEL